MTTVLHQAAQGALAQVLSTLGIPDADSRVLDCPKAELGHGAIGAALQGARVLRRSPMSIAHDIAQSIQGHGGIASAQVAAPGYVNIIFEDAAIAGALEMQACDPLLGVAQVASPEHVVIDFGGPNIKPMHVGHLRSLVIGESLRRMLACVGHHVVSDIHLGDWGLPSGMILDAIARSHPGLPWFESNPGVVYPAQLPVGVDELATLYPLAAAACREDPLRMASARACTARLQAGHPGLQALWTAIVELARTRILASCTRLGAHFDLLLGESHAQPHIAGLLADMVALGVARPDGDALLVDVALESDRTPMPPLVVAKADGGALYATTDLATLAVRVRELGAQRILYVVDARQHLHFVQVFRAARLAQLCPGVEFEHIEFGTVSGPDGKPLRTRDGNTMELESLLDSAQDAARARLVSGARLEGCTPDALDSAADAIGLAALRIADLSSNRTTGYTLDLERAVGFEGKTGPYLLYALVRLRAILARAGNPGPVVLTNDAERRMALACLGFGGTVHTALAARAPHELAAWAFDMAAEIGRFYAACPVLAEPDPVLRASRVALCTAAQAVLARALELLGCRVPEAM